MGVAQGEPLIVVLVVLMILGPVAGLEECSSSTFPPPDEPACVSRKDGVGQDVSVNKLTCTPEQDPERTLKDSTLTCYGTCAYEDFSIPFFGPIPRCRRCLDVSNTDLFKGISDTWYTSYSIVSPCNSNEEIPCVYSPSSICDYSVQCPAGFALYFTMIYHDLEPSVQGFEDECPDDLRIFFPSLGRDSESSTNFASPISKTCGSLDELPEESTFGYSSPTLTFSFQSNRRIERSGFAIHTLCVDPKFTPESCVHTESSIPGSPGRREANFDGVRDKRSFRVPCIKVTSDEEVQYQRYTLTVRSTKNGQLLRKFENILVFQVYNQVEGHVTYRKNGVPSTRTFPGYGELQIGKGVAQYIQHGVDPAVIMSAEERAIVQRLLGYLYERGFFAEASFRLGSGPQGPTTDPGPTNITPTLPTDPCSGGFDLMLVELAELHRNDCNLFLRSVAEAFIKHLEECEITPTPTPFTGVP